MTICHGGECTSEATEVVRYADGELMDYCTTHAVRALDSHIGAMEMVNL